MAISEEEENSIIDTMMLSESMQKLSKKYRLVLALYLSGYNQRECGVILGITRAAVGFIYKKATAALSKLVNEETKEYE